MGLGTIVSDLGEKAKHLGETLAESIKSNHKIVMIAAAAFLVIIVLLLVLAIVVHQRNQPKEADSAAPPVYATDTPSRNLFSEENFFLPYEPNFVPDVLLEREPRDGWAEEDARPFWSNPLEGNEDFWKKRIESGIDSLLENVP